jgi:hypothetical protein
MLFSSCSINGSLKGLYGYYNITKKDCPGLLVRPQAPDSICQRSQPATPVVYVINGVDLKRCLSGLNNALVYFWKSNCSSPMCYPIEVVQQKCNVQNVDLFVVAEYYDTYSMNNKYDVSRPVLGIDTRYYKSNMTKKYMSRFLQDLAEVEYTESSLYYFKKGQLVKVERDLSALFEEAGF